MSITHSLLLIFYKQKQFIPYNPVSACLITFRSLASYYMRNSPLLINLNYVLGIIFAILLPYPHSVTLNIHPYPDAMILSLLFRNLRVFSRVFISRARVNRITAKSLLALLSRASFPFSSSFTSACSFYHLLRFLIPTRGCQLISIPTLFYFPIT